MGGEGSVKDEGEAACQPERAEMHEPHPPAERAGKQPRRPRPPGKTASPSVTSPAGSSSCGASEDTIPEGMTAFEPDEAFFEACRNKGIVNPAEELRLRPLSDFMTGDVSRDIAQKRLDSYDMVRAKKLLLILEERMAILSTVARHCRRRKEHERAHTAPASTSSQSPKSLPGKMQLLTNIFARELLKERFCNQRVESALRVAKMQREHKLAEDKRREEANRELKVRHLITAMQRNEIQKENERLLAERHQQQQMDALVRKSIVREMEAEAEERRMQIEEKERKSAKEHEALVVKQRKAMDERGAKKAQLLERAKQYRDEVDRERKDRVLRTIADREEKVFRKLMADMEQAEAVRQRRELKDAYTQQVVARCRFMENKKAEQILRIQEEKLQRAEEFRSEVVHHSVWRSHVAKQIHDEHRHNVASRRVLEDKAMQMLSLEKVKKKDQQLEGAAQQRRAMRDEHAEDLRLAAQRKRELAQRALREKEVHLEHKRADLEDRHKRVQQKLIKRDQHIQRSQQRRRMMEDYISAYRAGLPEDELPLPEGMPALSSSASN